MNKNTMRNVLVTAVVVAGVLLLAVIPGRAKTEKVEILRDTYGIPHIFAETREGAYYGAGWAEAEDRAPFLVYLAVKAQGRVAEFVPSGEGPVKMNVVTADIKARALDYYGLAGNWRGLSEEVKDALGSYAAGFNDYVKAQGGARLESRFGSETGLDGAALIKDYGDVTVRDLVAIGIMKNAEEAMSNMSEMEMSKVRVAGGSSNASMSNAVAISGSLTKSGAPILYGDPHNTWTGAQRLAHLSAPGFTLFAQFQGPYALGGLSEHTAVAHTRNNPDGADVYIERVNTADPTQYMVGSEWRKMKKVQAEIKVKNGKPVKADIYYTHRGWVPNYPMSGEAPGFAYSIRIAVCDTMNDRGEATMSADEAMHQSWAESVAELYEASRTPYQAHRNFISADDDNNILYFWHGRVPVRIGDVNPKQDANYVNPVFGWNKWIDWQEGGVWRLGDALFPLPSYLNPRGGIITSANNAPWHAASCGEADHRPSWIPEHVVPSKTTNTPRGRVLRETLCGKKAKRSIEDIRKLAFNTLCPDARDFMFSIGNGWAEYEEELSNSGISEDVLALDAILRSWNFHSDIDQPGMTVMFHLRRMTELTWFDSDYIPTLDEMKTYFKELDRIVEIMKAYYGKLEVPWGDVHVIRRGGRELSIPGGTAMIQSLFMAHMGTVPFPGSSEQRDRLYGDLAGETDEKDKGMVVCNFGSSYIHAHVLDKENPMTLFVTPEGQTTADFFPDSKHLTQQTEKFAAGEWIEMPLKYKDVKAKLCPWGGDKNHEHRAVTNLQFNPGKVKNSK